MIEFLVVLFSHFPIGLLFAGCLFVTTWMICDSIFTKAARND